MRMKTKWKDLSGEERYRVVEMARKHQMPIKELCRTFGVSRQTLNAAMEKVDQAAMDALEPKSPGRKGQSKEQSQIANMKKEKLLLEKDLETWKQKYEIAMTFADIHRKLLNGEPLPGEVEEGKKRRGRKRKKSPGRDGQERTGTQMENRTDGPGDESTGSQS
jgi:transposase-like protein